MKTLKYAIETCLDQRDFDDYEIVINDNSDDEKTLRYVSLLVAENPRAREKIKYHKRFEVCSMSGNFEDAILRAEGEYIILIGDDDGIMPMALFELSKLVSETKASVIKWNNGLYIWPSMTFQGAQNYLGFCLLRTVGFRSGRAELANSLETLTYENLPMLYINSAIRHDMAESLRDSGGKMFRGRGADVYSAIVISYSCGDFLHVTVPFTLAGLSSNSTGVSVSFPGNNTDMRADFWRLNRREGIRHHAHVPNLPIFPAVDVADSFLHAKGHHFSTDDQFVLSRERIMRACVERCDLNDADMRKELLRVCEDDAELTKFTLNLIAQGLPRLPAPRLKPPHLGADGVNLHLDASEFGVETIKDAVDLVAKFVWPGGAPLRYDLQSPNN